MAVAIRLARGGAKKRPYYKIVVADARNARDGKFIERIGSYNPLLPKDSPDRVKLDTDRAKHWLSVGAQPSDRVHRFLDQADMSEQSTPGALRRMIDWGRQRLAACTSSEFGICLLRAIGLLRTSALRSLAT